MPESYGRVDRPPPHYMVSQPPAKRERADEKKEAAVGAVDINDPSVSTPDQLFDQVIHTEVPPRPPPPPNKQMRAYLVVGDQVAFFLLFGDRLSPPNLQGSKPVIFLSDGERALQDRQSEYLPENTVCILDSFHVMERLWKAAGCFFRRKTPKRQAGWLEKRLKRALEGVDASILGMLARPTHPARYERTGRKTGLQPGMYSERGRERIKYGVFSAAY